MLSPDDIRTPMSPAELAEERNMERIIDDILLRFFENGPSVSIAVPFITERVKQRLLKRYEKAGWWIKVVKHDEIGILQPPAGISGIEAIDAVEIGASDGEIAGLRALPDFAAKFAQWPKRQMQDRQQPVDAAVQALPDEPR